ncbi:hypothetical protein glysoja_025678 [Glycine soja]|uniref:Uncharacterized protein n=1 Tax=Glycine soja TaxID=3848 RepID=A0A0B2R9R4_GLYSO|nr:hypothetical protein glysoja_025678 [Glycine soja]
MIAIPEPCHQELLVLVHLSLDGGPPTQYLQQNDAERIHVGFLSQPKTHVVLRVQIPETTLHVRRHVGRVGPHLRQPKIRHFCHPILVQQDVRALHVAVYHALLVHARVEEVKPTRRLKTYVQPPLPRQLRTVQVVA